MEERIGREHEKEYLLWYNRDTGTVYDAQPENGLGRGTPCSEDEWACWHVWVRQRAYTRASATGVGAAHHAPAPSLPMRGQRAPAAGAQGSAAGQVGSAGLQARRGGRPGRINPQGYGEHAAMRCTPWASVGKSSCTATMHNNPACIYVNSWDALSEGGCPPARALLASKGPNSAAGQGVQRTNNLLAGEP